MHGDGEHEEKFWWWVYEGVNKLVIGVGSGGIK